MLSKKAERVCNESA